jgi:uncharacterized caspase-like protein
MRRGRPVVPMRLATAAAALLWLVAPAAGQQALKGVALVIGQSAYEGLAPLRNPKNDARGLDDLLDELGFDVNRVLDANAKELGEELAEFVEDAADADVALVYYSGHGIEAAGENYLIPIDADVSTPQKAGEKLIPLGRILDQLRATVPVTIFLLDACRTNSFPPGQMVQLPGTAAPIAVSAQGLAATRGDVLVAPTVRPEGLGTVIGFAASPGQAALDGEGENSPYAAALLKHLGAGGYAFGDVMTMVTEEVYLETSGRQLPWTNDALRRFLYFGKAVEERGTDEALIREGRRDLLLTIASAPEETRTVVESVAAGERVPLDALYGMLKVLGVDTSAGSAGLERQLRDGAERVRRFMSEGPGTAKTDAELIRLSELADRAQAEGAMDVALQFRERASARAAELSASRDALEQQLREDRLEIAETYAEHGATAALVFDFRTAEQKFEDAFEEVARWDDDKALEYKAVLASTRYWRGEKEGSVALMQRAIADYEAALTYVSRDEQPGDWAFIQRGLATVRTTLAEWSNDARQLEAAIATYRNVLDVLPAEAVVQRAITFNNLGLAYLSLGSRRAGTAELREALAALDEARRLVPGGDTIPLLESSLGLTLGTIGARERDRRKLEQAVAVLETTIAEDLTQPLEIAQAQSNLGLVLMELGTLTGDTAPTRRALDVLRKALKVQRRETAPQDWARIQLNLGLSLTMLGSHERDLAQLEEAVAAFDNALAEFDRSRVPVRWAMAVRDRGVAVLAQGMITGRPEPFAEAIAAYRLAEAELTKDAAPGEWGKTQANLFFALTKLGQVAWDTTYLREALKVSADMETVVTRAASPVEWAVNQYNLSDLQSLIYLIEGGLSWLDAAEAALRASAEVLTPEVDPAISMSIQLDLATTLARRAAETAEPAPLEEAHMLALDVLGKAAVAGDRATLAGVRYLLNEIDKLRRVF